MTTRLLILIGLALSVSGCAHFRGPDWLNSRSVEEVNANGAGSAKEKHAIALDLINQCDLTSAEQYLRAAITVDDSYGPAHNTLGKLYFDRKEFYFAATEFELATRAMPDRAEPVNNLGLVYESVGKTDQSVGYYQQANEMSPENAQYLGNLLRARIRRGDRTGDLRPLLQRLVFLDNRPEWVIWAKQQLVGGEIEEAIFSDVIGFPIDEYEVIEPGNQAPSTEGASPLVPIKLDAPLLPGLQPNLGSG